MSGQLKTYLWDWSVRSLSRLLTGANIVGWSKAKPIRRILIYHRVDAARRRDFERQIAYFVKNYKIVNLSRFIEILSENDQAAKDLLCLTFDDAYKSVYENACPVLDKYGIKPCIFVPVGFLEAADKTGYDKNNIGSAVAAVPMDWQELRSLADKGYEIGSHSVNHLDFGKAGIDYEFELLGSKSRLESALGREVKYFAFPFGRKRNISPIALDKAQSYGYRKVFSGVRGNVDDVAGFILPRTYININWDEDVLKCMLAGWFDG